MNSPATRQIIGQGLAGTCLAWHLWWRKLPFVLVDDDRGGSSRVAAGLINPVTGKNFEPTSGISGNLPEALAFYQKVGSELASTFWHPLPILRLAATPEEWGKIQSKLARPDVERWIAETSPAVPDGWHGGVLLHGGGRLDTRGLLDASRSFFQAHGVFAECVPKESVARDATILCDGSAGLMAGRTGPHRCAKGEILTLLAPDWQQDHIRIGAGGWLVPIGENQFKCGATYSWDQLDHSPTPHGRQFVDNIARRLGGHDFEVIAHEAGIRPILRRSEPLIGPLPSGEWLFNGLGSKGSLHAPATARRLADWLESGIEPPPQHDIRVFLAGLPQPT